MFKKAIVEHRSLEKLNGVPTVLRVGINVFDTVAGSKYFKLTIDGDDLDTVLSAQDQLAAGLEIAKQKLAPQYQSWVDGKSQTAENIPGKPEFTSLD